MAAPITLLHLSDIQFGKNHVFASAGLTKPDQHFDSLFGRLHDDLDLLRRDEGLTPDVVIVSGDLAEWGMGRELDHAERFLAQLTDHLRLPHERVVIVPGNHDVNRKACEAYFNQCDADETMPQPPYWPKWQHFAATFSRLYAGAPSIRFEVERPYTLFELPEMGLVVAGLNSTMAESHRDDDHYGWVGEAQLRWFAERLRELQDRDWLRVGVVHHNVLRLAESDDENLRDAEDLERLLASRLDLLLHGHTHNARLGRLASGLPVLSTGSAALRRDSRPPDVPNQYQVLRIEPGRIERWARRYEPDQKRWVGDNRVTDDGSDWRQTIPLAPDLRAKPRQPPSLVERERLEPHHDDFLDRLAEITRLRAPGAEVIRYFTEPVEYLRVALGTEGVARVYPLSGCEHDVRPEDIDRFASVVHDRYRAVDPLVTSELVYGGSRAAEELVERARRRGIRLTSFMEYQGILDLRAYRERLVSRLLADPVYPPHLYVPQRYSMIEGQDDAVRDGLLEAVVRWLAAPQGRFIMVLGDFGAGKTFLLHELARRIPDELPDLVPLLIELRSLQKARTLDELVALHLSGSGEDRIDLRAFRYMLREGRLVLLFDGFDELAFRVTYERAAEHFQTLLQAADGQAKIVVTSRSQHFISDEQVKTALGTRVEQVAGRRLARLEPFDEVQIHAFLASLFAGDQERAERRIALIRGVRDLLGLSHNPRMLAFMAELDEHQLEDAARERGWLSAAELYELLLTRWLEHEVDRAQPRGAAPALSLQARWEAVTRLARALWQRSERGVPASELSGAVAEAVEQLDAAELAHAVGSGTLLVRDEDGAFSFVHQSVMEWLVARWLAGRLRDDGSASDVLDRRAMSPLMADFLRDLAGHAVAWDWANGVLEQPDAGDVVKRNALLVLRGMGPALEKSDRPPGSGDLSGRDLAGADLAGADLSSATLAGANLRDAVLVGADLSLATLAGVVAHRAMLDRADLTGADLSGADFTGARLLGADLRGAELQRSTWRRAALIGAQLDPGALEGADVRGAALRPEQVVAQVVPGAPAAGVAFSPDGSLLAAAVGAAIVLYEPATGRALRVLEGHGDWTSSIAFSADGGLLASAGADRRVRLWDAATGEPVRVLEGHLGRVWTVAFQADGRLLASAGNDATVRLWDPATGELVGVIEAGSSGVWRIAFSPNGRLLASASPLGVRLWDPLGTGAGRTVSRPSSRDVAFSPDGRLLAAVGLAVRVWDAATQAALFETDPGANTVAFSPDSRLLAVGSGLVRIWDTSDWRQVHVLESGGGGPLSVAFSADGRLLATVGGDGSLRLWDTSDWQRAYAQREPGALRSVTFSADGRSLAAVGDRRRVQVFEAASGALVRTVDDGGHVRAAAFSGDGRLLVAGGVGGVVCVWDARSWEVRRRLASEGDAVRCLAFSRDGRLLATGGDDYRVRVWDVEDGRQVRLLKGHTGPIESVTFGASGLQVVSAGADGKVRFWVDTSVRLLSDGESPVRSVAVSPDARLVAAGGTDKKVRLWDPTSGERVNVLEGHTDWVWSVAFSPDGHTLASAGDDRMVRLWDVGSGAQLRVLQGHVGRVLNVAFSPDGRLILSSGSDGTIKLWDPDTGALHYTLIPLADGWACLTPDGPYKLEGTPAGEFWYAAGLCRFEPGELDPYVPHLKRLPADVPLLPGW